MQRSVLILQVQCACMSGGRACIHQGRGGGAAFRWGLACMVGRRVGGKAVEQPSSLAAWFVTYEGGGLVAGRVCRAHARTLQNSACLQLMHIKFK